MASAAASRRGGRCTATAPEAPQLRDLVSGRRGAVREIRGREAQQEVPPSRDRRIDDAMRAIPKTPPTAPAPTAPPSPAAAARDHFARARRDADPTASAWRGDRRRPAPRGSAQDAPDPTRLFFLVTRIVDHLFFLACRIVIYNLKFIACSTTSSSPRGQSSPRDRPQSRINGTGLDRPSVSAHGHASLPVIVNDPLVRRGLV